MRLRYEAMDFCKEIGSLPAPNSPAGRTEL
jgi:hypothetical protein